MQKNKKDIKAALRSVIRREVEKCMGRDGSTLSSERADLKRMYLGYGYETDEDRRERGLSTYVDRSVLEVVEWAKPGLLRAFCGSDEVIRYDPKTAEQEQSALDATLYVNQVVFGRNMFQLVDTVFTDGLMQRVGWCLAHFPKKTEQQVRKLSGLSKEEAQSMAESAILEGAQVEVQEKVGGQVSTYDMTIRRTVETQEIRLDPVPTEQVIVSADAQDVESARFIAHWKLKTASELRKEGYSADLIESLPAADADSRMPETTVGRSVNGEGEDSDDSPSGALREYRVYEGWFDYDINGDGVAERVKATWCGEDERCVLMGWEEWPLYRAPLFAACSVPMPHQVVGLCLADLVRDLQTLRTEMTRQYLDGLALGNQGEIVVNEGQSGSVEYDSLPARGVGSVHRIKGDASITPPPVTSNIADALQGLEMSKDIIERRTGVSSRTQSLKADALQNTATGASIMEEAVNQRLELVARVYAETFFKPLGRYLLHLLHCYHDKQIQLRLKDRFMEFNPQDWDPDMDISVAVGLGTGNRSKLLGAYAQILQIQQTMLAQLGPQVSPVKLSHIVHTCHKMAEAAGLEAPERFFGSEEDAKMASQAMANQPAQPSPEQQKLQLEQQKAQAKMRLDAQKVQTDAQRKAFETQAKIDLERQKAQGQLAMKAQEMALEANLDARRMAMGDRSPGLTNVRQA
jgi:hypothetical protein